MSRTSILVACGYALLAAVLTWPLVLHLGSALPGYPNVDALDTITLRGLAARMLSHPRELPWTDGIYWPSGYPALWLMPNVADHLGGAPFALWLPFPLGDGLWWLLTLAANGLAAHRLGRQLGGTHAAGALCGVAYACSEPILREANLLHAPQSLAPWAPLFLAALLRATGDGGTRRDATAAGCWLALAGLTYWYYGLFLAIGAIPLALARRREWRHSLLAAVVAVALALPGALPWALHWRELPLADPENAPAPVDMRSALDPVPRSLRFVTEHGDDPLLPFHRSPIDRSNRVSLVLAAAAAWVLLRERRTWPLAAMALVGWLFALGPYLKWGEDPLLFGGHLVPLPFLWLGSLHPFLARLTWPERWGLLVALGMAALASRARHPGWLAALVLAETLWRSGNAPLQLDDLRDLDGWRALGATSGAVLELPLYRGGLQAPLVGLHARYHRRPILNPLLLPPGSKAPAAWRSLVSGDPVLSWLRSFERGGGLDPPDRSDLEALASMGVGAIAVDALPGSMLTEGGVNRFHWGLSRLLGPPEDHGAVLIWWLRPPGRHPDPIDDGAAWRRSVARRLAASPAPSLDTMIRPTWNERRSRPLVE